MSEERDQKKIIYSNLNYLNILSSGKRNYEWSMRASLRQLSRYTVHCEVYDVRVRHTLHNANLYSNMR